MKLTQRTSALIFVPASACVNQSFFRSDTSKKLMPCFAIILTTAGLYCLVVATFKYYSDQPAFPFFYHPLVKPLSQHAIQFSVLVFTALICLTENLKKNLTSSANLFARPAVAFLSLFLILLSSKLIICFYIAYLLSLFLYKRPFKTKNIIVASALITTMIILMITRNPVGNRFRAIFSGNYELFTQRKFNPGVRFNGVQFRLLQWRFTYEILNEQHEWLTGLTPGDAQSYLDKKYVETNMYTGVAGTDNHGFLGYHTHNQFLQLTLENGLPALVLFLLICYAYIKMAIESKRNEQRWVIALLIFYCFTDAPLNTQYGLVIFLFLPAFLCLQDKPVFRSVKKYRSRLTDTLQI
jgi:O-antigen ligase